jgi:hypothetical protein
LRVDIQERTDQVLCLVYLLQVNWDNASILWVRVEVQ